jgi:hypothetical protein
MRDNPIIQAVALVATLGAVGAMVIIGHGGFGPAPTREPHQAAGAELARQAISLLQPGGRITVITRDTSLFPNPATDILMESFQEELRARHVSIDAVEKLQVDPLRLISVPPGDFQNWIHQSAAGDVIVSFMGPPLLTEAQWQPLGEIKPAIVAFCPGSGLQPVDYRPLFAHGRLRAAVASRRDKSSPAVKSKNPLAWFDQDFVVVTATNVDDFMAPPEKTSASASP